MRNALTVSIGAVALLALVTLFQNCGPGFKVNSYLEQASSSSFGGGVPGDGSNGGSGDTTVEPTPVPGPTPVAKLCPDVSLPGSNVNAPGKLFDVTRIRKIYGYNATQDFIDACPTEPALPAYMFSSFDPPATYVNGSTLPSEEITTYMQPWRDWSNAFFKIPDYALRIKNDTAAKQANCALTWLDDLAMRGAFESIVATNNQANYERMWATGSLLIGYAKILAATTSLDATRKARVDAWFKRLHPAIMPYFVNREMDPVNHNNMIVSTGMMNLAYGLIFNDTAAIDGAKTRYGLWMTNIRADGASPAELARNENAYIYHILSLKTSVIMAEMLLTARGENLYTQYDGKLQKLFNLITNSFSDFALFTSLVPGYTQNHTPQIMMEQNKGYLAWMEIWFSRFGDPRLATLLTTARKTPTGVPGTIFDWRTGGSATYTWGVKKECVATSTASADLCDPIARSTELCPDSTREVYRQVLLKEAASPSCSSGIPRMQVTAFCTSQP